ncbi:CBS domain-containing protein [Chloropicon primus]|uniref:CBS domain-containing protein n=1 Tax=Chloropicon primus TaxID=1764295 RepID=A0A5B8MFZ2_9CHLO|nr:hypothetical protein A3770_02p18470 [Chloropicon primus]UPQ98538.1 CBS domain-containing protein [Chloropicon primus]|mmetsp:Transcript_8288/g.23710  ORF Transcript_8288/g.23710 Transcript_8288/m.23710 type:complete len:204 (-) Transcript_8288:260-871(-)|eukprot:QDZ19329.1 hypothetical protein A3770_02p18470 [Chloropicon primus]
MNARIVTRSNVAAAFGGKIAGRSQARRTSLHRARFQGIRAYGQPDISDSIDEDVIPSGEWPANWSLASYEDVGEYYAGQVLKEQEQNNVSGVMTTNILTAEPTSSVESVRKLFDHVSGVPVVDSEGTCVGIISKKDLDKKGSTVSQIMSAPARTIKKNNSVGEAAAIMLKYKVNRLPVVNKGGEVIGIVSRTDIFTALESMEE